MRSLPIAAASHCIKRSRAFARSRPRAHAPENVWVNCSLVMPVIAVTSFGSHIKAPNRSTNAMSRSDGTIGSSRICASIAYTRSVKGSDASGGRITEIRSNDFNR